jgi:putative ABC transport system permease protein
MELTMYYWRLALLNTTRNRRRSILAIALMAVGTAALAVNTGIITFIFDGLRDDAIYGRFGHVQFYRQGYLQNHRRDPFHYLVPTQEYDKISALLRRSPHVTGVTAELTLPVVVYAAGRTAAANTLGEDPSQTSLLSNIRIDQGEGTLKDHNGVATALVGRGLAEKLQVRVGDVMTLIANGRNQTYAATDVFVGGIFEEGFREYDDWSLKVPLKVTQYLAGEECVEAILVFLDNHATVEATRRQTSVLLEAAGFSLESATWVELADFYRQVIAMFGKELRVIMVIVEVVAWFGILDVLWMMFTERQREMAALLSMGMTRFRLALLFLQEGIWLGLAGAIAGTLSSVLIAKVISGIGIPMPPPPGSTRGFVAYVALSQSGLLRPALFTLMTALVASLVPALWIWRLDLARSLRPIEG